MMLKTYQSEQNREPPCMVDIGEPQPIQPHQRCGRICALDVARFGGGALQNQRAYSRKNDHYQ